MGAFHTGPTLRVLAEANVLPLNYIRKILICKHACKLSTLPENPSTKKIFIDENYSTYSEAAYIPQPFAQRLYQILSDINQTIPDILRQPPPTMPTNITDIEIINDNFFRHNHQKNMYSSP